MTSELLQIYDKRGFRYFVKLEHRPEFGYSTAHHGGRIIGQVELNKMYEPSSDDDAQWEHYEQRFAEWRDAVKESMTRICTEHFNHASD